jgi:hypothetical protein
MRWEDYLAIVSGILAFALIVAWVDRARAQDCREGDYGCGHEINHEQYKGWSRPDGGSCCNDGDCRPTRAYKDENGNWMALVDGRYELVPADKVLGTDLFKDGRNHICASQAINRDTGGHWIYCFTPAEPKS